MNVVSETLNWRASACMAARSSWLPSSTTHNGLPDSRAPPAVNTLRMRNLSSMARDYFTTLTARNVEGNPCQCSCVENFSNCTGASRRDLEQFGLPGTCVQLLGVPQRQLTAARFDQRGTTLHPVAIVAIEHAIDVAHARAVNVSTDDAVEIAAERGLRGGVLERGDVLDGLGQPQFEIRRQRPVRHAECAAARVDAAIEPHHEFIRRGTETRQPAAVLHGRVEFIPVHDEKLA